VFFENLKRPINRLIYKYFSMANFLNISEKLEDFRRQFESSRKTFKILSNELKPMLSHNPDLETRVCENNRIIETFLTSIKNTSFLFKKAFFLSLFLVDFNIDKVHEAIYDHSIEDLSKNFFTNCFVSLVFFILISLLRQILYFLSRRMKIMRIMRISL